MKHEEGTFTGARGMSIYYQYWLPDDAAKALVLLVHGAGEHSGRYRHLAEKFTASSDRRLRLGSSRNSAGPLANSVPLNWSSMKMRKFGRSFIAW